VSLSGVQRLAGGLFVLPLLLVVVATLAPSSALQLRPLQQILDAATGLDPKTLGLGLSVAVGLLLAAVLLFTSPPTDADPVFDQYRARPPEIATADRGDRVGRRFDEQLDASSSDLSRLRERLRPVAVDHYGAVSEDDPETAVETGTWTDRRAAAVFLGSEVSPTLVERLRRWLDPETEYRRRVEATVAAIDALGEETA